MKSKKQKKQFAPYWGMPEDEIFVLEYASDDPIADVLYLERCDELDNLLQSEKVYRYKPQCPWCDVLVDEGMQIEHCLL